MSDTTVIEMPKTSLKDRVSRHKTKVLVAALVTTTTVVVLQNRGIKSLNEFLKDNGLYDAYYTVTE